MTGRNFRRCLWLLPLGAAAWLLAAGGHSAGTEPASSPRVAAVQSLPVPPAPSGDELLAHPKYLGVGSCAASNCHGGPGDVTMIGSEYSIWVQRDPHARAYSVLFNEESQLMARNLGLDVPAHQAQVCLACHSITPDPHLVADGHAYALQDGVGCESCHGPAERWIEPHKRPDWKLRSPEDKGALGFHDTKDLLTRTRLCADCHVGGEGRDVNHDLIAAGHPRLNFEMSAYNANMPAHWNRNNDRRRTSVAAGPDPSAVRSHFEAKLWALGQVAAAEQAIGLLEQRADDERAPWPEFAEYGCFACHHDLQYPSWRQQRGYAGRRPGDYPWGTWTFALLPGLAEQAQGPALAGEDAPFHRLAREMGRPLPDREAVASLSSTLRQDLAGWAERLNRDELSPEEWHQLLLWLTGNVRDLTAEGWDAAAQAYLGAVALHQGAADAAGRIGPTLSSRDREAVASFAAVRELLRFPHEPGVLYDSPRDFGPETLERVNAAFEQIHRLMARE